MSKIFIFEDDENRIKYFEEYLGDDNELYIARNTDRAIKLWKNDTFLLALLDHDIGQTENVADWIINHSPNFDNMNVIIHSMNPIGAERIKNLVSHSIIFPFGLTLLEKLDRFYNYHEYQRM